MAEMGKTQPQIHVEFRQFVYERMNAKKSSFFLLLKD